MRERELTERVIPSTCGCVTLTDKGVRTLERCVERMPTDPVKYTERLNAMVKFMRAQQGRHGR